ncbi:MAG: DnaD domain protein [Anaerolineae bacterium]|nr:DnaD domain protein [Anaerolineae bacterium]
MAVSDDLMIEPFEGFPPGKMHLIRLPAPFFTDLLPRIDDVNELKLVLFCFWALEQREGRFRYLRRADFGVPEAPAPLDDEEHLALALARAIKREVLLTALVEGQDGPEMLYFLNTANGRAGVQMIREGQWKPGDANHPAELLPDQPNIFKLYEQNIGLLTPMIAEELRDAARTFPAGWIEEALHIAVTRNARNWRYVRAILERWQKEGKDDGTGTGPGASRGDSEASRNRFVSGKFADIIES